jgi:hypothetical protein
MCGGGKKHVKPFLKQYTPNFRYVEHFLKNIFIALMSSNLVVIDFDASSV